MGDLNVSSVGDNNRVYPQYDNSMRYGAGVEINKSLFSKGDSNVNFGVSLQGYLPSRGKAVIDFNYKHKLSEKFSIGGGVEGSYSIQTKDNVNQLTFDHRANLGFSGPIDFAEPYNITIIDPEAPEVYVASGIEKAPEVGDVIDEVKISEKTSTAPNQRATIAAKGFVDYQPNDKVSFTAGVKLGMQYDIGGKTLTKGADYKSVINSSKFSGPWYDTEAGEPPYSLYENYIVSSEIVKTDYSSSTNNNDNRFKVGLYGEADYKVNGSFKIGVFGDTFHKEAGIKAKFTF